MYFFTQGDSGGALTYMNGTHNIQLGIASYVPGDGCLAGPTVWVRVTAYLGWISDNVGQGKQFNNSNNIFSLRSFCL